MPSQAFTHAQAGARQLDDCIEYCFRGLTAYVQGTGGITTISLAVIIDHVTSLMSLLCCPPGQDGQVVAVAIMTAAIHVIPVENNRQGLEAF